MLFWIEAKQSLCKCNLHENANLETNINSNLALRLWGMKQKNYFLTLLTLSTLMWFLLFYSPKPTGVKVLLYQNWPIAFWGDLFVFISLLTSKIRHIKTHSVILFLSFFECSIGLPNSIFHPSWSFHDLILHSPA